MSMLEASAKIDPAARSADPAPSTRSDDDVEKHLLQKEI